MQQNIQDFPNACSGKLNVQVEKETIGRPSLGSTIKDFSYGMALYFYSSYNETDRKIHEYIEAKYALNTDGICSVDCEFVHGTCFGLDSDPRAPENPPLAPVVEGASPSFPVVDAKPPPEKIEKGGWIWPFLFCMLLSLASEVGGGGTGTAGGTSELTKCSSMMMACHNMIIMH